MKLESKILIKFASVICFGILLIVLSKFILQGFGSINHLPVSALNTFPGAQIEKKLVIIIFAIFLSFFISSKITFYLIIFPIAFFSALYSPIASVYGAPDYQSVVSLLATNFSESFEFLSSIPVKQYGKSLLIIALAIACHLIGKKQRLNHGRIRLMFCSPVFFL